MRTGYAFRFSVGGKSCKISSRGKPENLCCAESHASLAGFEMDLFYANGELGTFTSVKHIRYIGLLLKPKSVILLQH